MTVSIIIPTYDRKQLLTSCVESLLAQSYRDIEIIIVDDGSTDDTRQWISSRFSDPRIHFIRNEKNSGAYVARNIGLDAARGDFILHWDSDDDLYPNAIEALVDVVKKHPETELVSAPTEFRHGERIITTPERPDGPVSYEDYLRGRLPQNAVIWMISREKAGSIRYCAPNIDFTYTHRLAKICRWQHLNRPLGLVRLRADALSETIRRNIPDVDKSIRRARCLARFLDEMGEDLKKYAPGRYAGICYGTAVGLLLDGDSVAARRFARHAARFDPSLINRSFYSFTFMPFAPALLRWSFLLKRLLRKKK